MDIKDAIKITIAEQLQVNIKRVVPKAVLGNDLGADSIDVAVIRIELDDEYGILVDVKEADSVSDVIKNVKILLNQKKDKTKG